MLMYKYKHDFQLRDFVTVTNSSGPKQTVQSVINSPRLGVYSHTTKSALHVDTGDHDHAC